MFDRRDDGASPGLVALAISDGTFKRAVLTSLVIGTVLTIINQGDVILAGRAPSLIKVCLTFVVPYLVATYGAVSAKQAALAKTRDGA